MNMFVALYIKLYISHGIRERVNKNHYNNEKSLLKYFFLNVLLEVGVEGVVVC